MSGDPAVQAAQRADEMCDGTWIDGGRELAVTAAREALAPIRELHRPTEHTRLVGFPRAYQAEPYCVEDQKSWPCDTARLCYTTGELETP